VTKARKGKTKKKGIAAVKAVSAAISAGLFLLATALPAAAQGSAPAGASAGKPKAAAQARPAAAPKEHPNEPWRITTFFGTLYKKIPRETVAYRTNYSPGTIVVNHSERFLYYVLGGGQAIRYNIGIGREGATWSGVSHVSQKREWPDWVPTPAILAREPNLPRHMPGGPNNPLGARALYLGDTLYRIHGTNEPWKIGAAASAGCIRMANEDAIDLYERTKIGATVVVLR
jgi:lipoprotein-anchoring transpeptidase ErfK/SrfK